MTDTTSGGYPAGDERVSRRLPLRTTSQTATRPAGTDPWNADSTGRDDDNPFAGTALGSLPDPNAPVNPFDRPAPGSPSALGDDDAGRRARTSFPITIGLILTVIAACASLTAVLAPAAIVVGGLGVVLSVLGLFTARRPHVGGRVIAVLAILIGLGAVGLGVADHLGTFGWLNDDLPLHARNWLNDHVPFMKG